MFKMRYWRSYPRGLQMILLFLMMYTFFQFCAFLWGMLVTQGFGMSPEVFGDPEMAERPQVLLLRLLLTASQTLGFFLLPALVFAYLAHPHPMKYLGLRGRILPLHAVLVSWTTMGFIPLIQTLAGWFRQFDFGPFFGEQLKAREALIDSYIRMELPGGIFWVLLVLALLPALGEELLFRGIIQRSLHARTGHTGISIAITALIFSLFHFDPYGLIAIFAAGLLLGWIYHITGSLWWSILAHFLNNGLQVLVLYWTRDRPEWEAYLEQGSVMMLMLGAGGLIFGSGVYFLRKRSRPLPWNWSDDFFPPEQGLPQESPPPNNKNF